MTHAVIDGPIHIIGAGTLGMHIARSLDELGPHRIKSPIHFWDGDTVERHNVRVQLFRDEHLRMPKVEAARQVIGGWSGLETIAHNRFVGDEDIGLTGTVFVCVHSMAARKNIWQKCLRGNGEVLMIESRVGEDTGTVHTLDPSLQNYIDMWEHYWYPDPPGPPVSCGETVSLGPIVPLIAQIASWQLVRFCEIVHGSDDRLANQIQVGMRPPRLDSYFW